MKNLNDKINIDAVGTLLAKTMIRGSTILLTGMLIGEAYQLEQDISKIVKDRKEYSILLKDSKQSQKTYQQKLAQYGDFNKDGKVDSKEKNKFENDFLKYRNFRTKNYKGKMPKNHTKESYKLAIKWRKEYNPNWRKK